MNKKNYKYYAFSISNFILFHVPILTIYFNSILKSVTLVSILFFIKSFTVLIFEIPTGYISDRYSRKISLIIGTIFNILTLTLFVYKPNFYSLILAEFCFGLSECFSSGSNYAFYYDNFKAENRSNDYNHFIKNLGFIQSIFLSISFFIGSILYGYNIKIVFISSVLFQIISLIILIQIKEHPFNKNTDYKPNIKHEIEIFIKHYDNNIFYILIIYSLMLAIFLSIYLQLFPIITYTLTDNYYLYGIIYVFVMITYGIGAKMGNEDILNSAKLLFFLFFLMLIGVVFKNNIYVLFTIIITRFIWGYINTSFNIYINKNISDSSFRATIFSILSMLTSLFSSLLMFLMGWIIDKDIGLKILFATWSFIIFILLIFFKKILFSKGGVINVLYRTKM